MSNSALRVLAGAGAKDDPVYVDDVFSTFLYEGNGGIQGIPNGINLGDFGVGTSTRFNGTGDHLSRSSDLTGNADGKTFTFSCWVFLPLMDNRAGNVNQRVLYATDSSDNGIAINVDSSGQLGIEAGDGSGSWKLQATASTVIGRNVWTHILVSVDMANSSNRYVYLNDVAASVTWNVYTNTNLDFTRSTHYIGVWGNGTARYFYNDMAHFYLDYTYRDLSTESNRRIFIDANGGSTSASSLTALNPIMYLPMTTAYAVGKNAGTGGDFTVNGSPTIVENGTEYVADSGEGGLVWTKWRSGYYTSRDNNLWDTERGTTAYLNTNNTAAQNTSYTNAITYNSNGFTLNNKFPSNMSFGDETFASWTFRKQPGFFDVVTYTGNGSNRTISHNLGSVPGVMIVKKTSDTEGWQVYHRSLATNEYLELNSTSPKTTANGTLRWNSTRPTATEFSLGTHDSVNANGSTYVAYLFAHDAQDFGEDSDEAIIKCGTYTGNGSSSGPTVDLGFEPQWLLIKNVEDSRDWVILDSMRGITTGGNDERLHPNSSTSESGDTLLDLTSTGFQLTYTGDQVNGNNEDYIYVAIRRPHKPPEAGTEVFMPVSASTSPYPITVTSGFPIDMVIMGDLPTSWGYNWSIQDRLRGGKNVLLTSSTGTENTNSNTTLDSNTGLTNGWVSGGTTGLFQMFKRAPGFFDVVVANASNPAVANPHNLGVVPELVIIRRTVYTGNNWSVSTNHTSTTMTSKYLNSTSVSGQGLNTAYTANYNLLGAQPTATNFTMINQSDGPFVCYLFASVDGISKVGSYTGTGNGQDLNVDCGFSAGARFVLITRVDNSGDWYVWDTARGIVAGNDPYLLFNDTGAQVTNTDYIDPLSSGFTVTSSAPAGLNASGGTYIFLAIA